MKRAAIFAHYDVHDIVDDYVVYYLKQLREVCGHIVFVTTSNAPESELSKTKDICREVIKRDNVGYDFMSYKVGLEHLDSGAFDEVVICNDSVYGPLFPLTEPFDKMQEDECDFWGMTESHERAYHLQSYFMVLRKKALESRCFEQFWHNITPVSRKGEIIERYEVGLSQTLVRNGFLPGVYASYSPGILHLYRTFLSTYLRKTISGLFKKASGPNAEKKRKSLVKRIVRFLRYNQLRKNLNPTHFFWIDIINNRRMPFIKVELLRDNPMYMNTRDFEFEIKKSSDYDTSYIRRHLARVGNHPLSITLRTGAGEIPK